MLFRGKVSKGVPEPMASVCKDMETVQPENIYWALTMCQELSKKAGERGA